MNDMPKRRKVRRQGRGCLARTRRLPNFWKAPAMPSPASRPIAPADLPRARALAQAARKAAAKLGDLQLARAAASLAQRVKESEQPPPNPPNRPV